MEALSSPNVIHLKPGQMIHVEPGAMLAYHNCEMRTKLAASSVFSRWLVGESGVQNQFTAGARGGWIALEEYMPGQIVKETLSPLKPALMIRHAALIAESPNVRLESRYLGLPGYLSGKGVCMTRASVEHTDGDVHFHSTEGVVRTFRVTSKDGPIYVDNHMILAYSDNLRTEVCEAQSALSWFCSGEGLVTKFEGDGVVYVGAVQEQYKPPATRTRS